jgi:hypothetical protein
MLNLAVVWLLLLQAATVTRPGVITGQLQTREGAPAAAIRITALPAPPPNIRPSDGQNYYAATPPASTTLTDTQGRYRLTNLAPGRYFVLASVFGYPTFHPSTTNADNATVITVGDAPVDGVNFTVIMPPGGGVSGRVNTPPPPGFQEKAILSGVELGELLETPVAADGSFTFGHLPKGTYLLSLFPTPPGMPSRMFDLGETDARIDLVRPTLRTVTGRLVVPRGPVPHTLLAFFTDTSYVTASIDPDGTFRTQLQPARHNIELAGMPIGYALNSVRMGGQDVTQGMVVGSSNVSDVVVTISPPAHLPRVRGKVLGVPQARLASARVELTGSVIGALEAPVQQDGSFEFAAVAPGTYRVRVPQEPGIAPFFVVVVGVSDTEIQIGR